MATDNTFFGRPYRADISGLRGLAVLMVVLYHVDASLMPGGFLGVDVFLVISGYLISGHLLHDVEAGTFRFHRFYARRLRRLFPALFFTILATGIAGYFVLDPPQYERLSLSALAGTFSASNFFFLSEAGYFDAASEAKPLLHLWSLSVEEQFYLLWPALILVGVRWARRHLFGLMALLALVSVGLCALWVTNHPATVFFMLPFRLFEFLLGALVLSLPKALAPARRESLFWVGLALVVASGYLFSDATPLPGPWALVPCGGAALVLYAGQGAWGRRVLSFFPLERIGLASYSIYLAHWPLLVLYTLAYPDTTTLNVRLVLGGIAVVLGFVMWKGLENPWRRRRSSVGRDRVWVAVPCLALLLSVGALWVRQTQGFSQRFPDLIFLSQEEIKAEAYRFWKYREETHRANERLADTEDAKTVLIMGNSHSIGLVYALLDQHMEARIERLATNNRCYNFGSPITPEDAAKCAADLAQNLADSSWQYADLVLLTDDWQRCESQDLYGRIMQLRQLTSAPIVVMGPRMVYRKLVPSLTLKSGSIIPDSVNAYVQRFGRYQKVERTNRVMKRFFYEKKAFAPEDNVYYLDFLSLQRGADGIYEVIDPETRELYYFDRGHFTRAGARYMGRLLRQHYPELFSLNPSALTYEVFADSAR